MVGIFKVPLPAPCGLPIAAGAAHFRATLSVYG
jgi:hypothetical protein